MPIRKVNNDLDGANISPDRLNLYAAYDNGPFDARLATRFHFERKFNDASTDSDFEGYTLFDAAAGYRFGKHRVSLSAMNLFDKYYVSYNSDTVAATDPDSLLRRARPDRHAWPDEPILT